MKTTPLYLAAFLCMTPASLRADPFEIVVYGGTSGGISAAIQAARMGKRVALIEPTKHLGGLTTGGLGATDIGNKKAIGGISREFYQRIFRHYDVAAQWVHGTREEYFSRKNHGTSAQEDTMWTFEPHVATALYEQMLAEVKGKVTVVRGERLDLTRGVLKEGGRIAQIRMESGRTFEGKMYIDASYEGDLMAKAGVGYTVGRESNATYGETLNGVAVQHAKSHQFLAAKVDAYKIPGDPQSGLLPGIKADPGVDGAGDRKVQAYNFRMCTTDVPQNRRDWEKPAGYDPSWFELALRNVEAGDRRISWHPVWMPNRKTDTNNNFAVSTDFIGQNWDYAEANYATRERIWKAHEDWQKGLMWTYAHHPRVPEELRAAFQKLGLAKDEFVENDNWPRQLYIREARRMVGDYVMTEKNCRRQEVVEDSVGMGAYNMDSHHVQRYVDKNGSVRNEGDVQVKSKPYPISYRSIRPKASECANLLVPVCLSASHIAYGSIRMEPVFMVLGQSAATAAVFAIEDGKSVQEVDYARLKARLEADLQTLDFELPAEQASAGISRDALGGMVIDDAEAELVGFSAEGSAAGPYVGSGYRHDGNSEKGMQRARFTPNVPEAGRYRVAITYSALTNRAANVPVIVHHAEGEVRVVVDQRSRPSEDGRLHSLGEFVFEPGRGGWIEIRNDGTNGHVIVDAVQLKRIR
jgi:hypothetical protein